MYIYSYVCYYWQTWLDTSVKMILELLVYVGTNQSNIISFLEQFDLQHNIGACCIRKIWVCIVFSVSYKISYSTYKKYLLY